MIRLMIAGLHSGGGKTRSASRRLFGRKILQTRRHSARCGRISDSHLAGSDNLNSLIRQLSCRFYPAADSERRLLPRHCGFAEDISRAGSHFFVRNPPFFHPA